MTMFVLVLLLRKEASLSPGKGVPVLSRNSWEKVTAVGKTR